MKTSRTPLSPDSLFGLEDTNSLDLCRLLMIWFLIIAAEIEGKTLHYTYLFCIWILSNIKWGVGLNNSCLYKEYVIVICYFAFFFLVHSNEENDVLQHAYTYSSEEPGREPARTDSEEEHYVTDTWRVHQNTQSHPQECMYITVHETFFKWF